MNKKALFILTLGLALVAASVGGAEEITIVGSGDGVMVLDAIGKAFSQANQDVRIIIPESIGSGGGVKAAGMDKHQIARVARGIEEKEKPYGLSYVPYAKVATVFFTNKNVGIENLQAQQICDIYSGKITHWKDVGGKDAKIRVVRREDGDSSLNVLQKFFPGFKDISITDFSKITFSTPETFTVIESTPDSIGFGPYDVAKNADVAVLKINDKSPNDPDYICFTTLAFVFKESNKTGNLQKFIEFATSPAAHKAIKGSGGIPF